MRGRVRGTDEDQVTDVGELDAEEVTGTGWTRPSDEAFGSNAFLRGGAGEGGHSSGSAGGGAAGWDEAADHRARTGWVVCVKVLQKGISGPKTLLSPEAVWVVRSPAPEPWPATLSLGISCHRPGPQTAPPPHRAGIHDAI